MLAWLERSGLVESLHLGVLAVVDPDGDVHLSAGDLDRPLYGRSVLKPLQAIATLRTGAPLEATSLAIAVASHEGTEQHLALVRHVLDLARLPEDALLCPAAWPTDFDARRLAAAPSAIAMNCSGKHASFLLACQANGWPIHDYLDTEHPLQRQIREVVEDICGETVAHVGVDGCGAPVFATSFCGLATGFARTVRSAEGRRVRTSMADHPWAVDSPDVARAIRELGVIAKRGAEGVCVVSAPSGLTALVKTMDGNPRPSLQVALLALADAGGIDRSAAESFVEATAEPAMGGGTPVGGLRFARFVARVAA